MALQRPPIVRLEFRLQLSPGWKEVPGTFTRAEALKRILEARKHSTHSYRLKSYEDDR